jgi:hypothetical protein
MIMGENDLRKYTIEEKLGHMALKRSPLIDTGIGGILLKLELGPLILLERTNPGLVSKRLGAFLLIFFYYTAKLMVRKIKE